MTILLTGSTGYIGRRLLTALLEDNHNIICLVRDRRRFDWEDFSAEQLQRIQVVEGDLVKEETLLHIAAQADIAYYLVHSMSYSEKAFETLEETSAANFVTIANRCKVKQIVYLGGIANDVQLSKHLSSRKHVEEILQTANAPVTVLRAAIIIGSGSASFEIIRDLVEKLPIMVAPKWLNSKCQPIGIRNVIEYLKGVALLPSTYNKVFDIGGPDVLTYKEMLLGYARIRNLKRWIITVPVLSPGLSS
ncbi:MAG: NAD(P)H-binding protein, partial [Cyclobacteriaceae bacterium]|nr:NAD(P)H-binding protein [Cyclobacteriaceae bacterium]